MVTQSEKNCFIFSWLGNGCASEKTVQQSRKLCLQLTTCKNGATRGVLNGSRDADNLTLEMHLTVTVCLLLWLRLHPWDPLYVFDLMFVLAAPEM